MVFGATPRGGSYASSQCSDVKRPPKLSECDKVTRGNDV